MKAVFWIGLVLLILGLASLVVPIPRQERHGVEVGDVAVGVQTESREKVSPVVSGVLIVAGAGMMIAGGRTRRA